MVFGCEEKARPPLVFVFFLPAAGDVRAVFKNAFLEPFQASLGVGDAIFGLSATGSFCSTILGANGNGETRFAKSEYFFTDFFIPSQMDFFGDGNGGDVIFSY